MNTKIVTYCATLLLAALAGLHADESAKPKPASPEFERMKSLVGTWKGTADMGQGPVEMVVEYRLIAGGTVLQERSFPNTPHEMVTMFYDKGGRLALTHYCVLGNQPTMALRPRTRIRSPSTSMQAAARSTRKRNRTCTR